MQSQWPSIQSLPYQDLTQINEILRKLDAMDKKFNTKDCSDDAAKHAFLKELADRIAKLEAAAK